MRAGKAPALQNNLAGGGVYISYFSIGGPVAKGGIYAAKLVRELNGQPVANLDDFIRIAGMLKDGDAVQFSVEAMNGRRDVNTIELDLVYWPTSVIDLTDKGWQITFWRQWVPKKTP